MAKDGLTSRPWYRWSPRDFLADPTVASMEREQRWRYREALDFSWLSQTPGIAIEDQWRKWLGYTPEQWSTAREAFICAFEVNEPHWIQKRLADEHAHATLKSNSARLSGLARQSANAQRPVSERSADAQRTLAYAIESKKNQSKIEAKREPENLTLSSPAATLALSLNGSEPDSPEFLSFPCVGTGPKAYRITEAGVLRLAELFPGPDVRQSLRNALAWILANPAKRKTARGMDRFIASWLTRDQESGRTPRATVGAGMSIDDRAAAMVAAMNGGKP